MRFLPHLIWIAGLFVLFAGVLVGPGVPYQDPTPEMRLLEEQQTHLADRFFTVGLVLFIGGVVLAMVVWLVRRHRHRTGSPDAS